MTGGTASIDNRMALPMSHRRPNRTGRDRVFGT
jgi:hypothetical protein